MGGPGSPIAVGNNGQRYIQTKIKIKIKGLFSNFFFSFLNNLINIYYINCNILTLFFFFLKL